MRSRMQSVPPQSSGFLPLPLCPSLENGFIFIFHLLSFLFLSFFLLPALSSSIPFFLSFCHPFFLSFFLSFSVSSFPFSFLYFPLIVLPLLILIDLQSGSVRCSPGHGVGMAEISKPAQGFYISFSAPGSHPRRAGSRQPLSPSMAPFPGLDPPVQFLLSQADRVGLIMS